MTAYPHTKNNLEDILKNSTKFQNLKFYAWTKVKPSYPTPSRTAAMHSRNLCAFSERRGEVGFKSQKEREKKNEHHEESE